MDENRKRELEFHKNRRMFAILNGKLIIAPESTTFSHLEWLESKGFLDKNIDFNNFVRGFVDPEGIYFYGLNDFSVDEKMEKIFFQKLNELIDILKINCNKNVFGGMIPKERLGKWEPRKKYGEVKKILNK